MYPLETRELAVEAVAAGFSLTEAAELAGCSRTDVVNWAKAAGVAPPPRKKAVYLPFDRKMELVARLEAGERAADLAAEAGVTAAAVSGWRRRLREEGALSLMTDSDIAARAPEPREAPSELEELRARCEVYSSIKKSTFRSAGFRHFAGKRRRTSHPSLPISRASAPRPSSCSGR